MSAGDERTNGKRRAGAGPRRPGLAHLRAMAFGRPLMLTAARADEIGEALRRRSAGVRLGPDELARWERAAAAGAGPDARRAALPPVAADRSPSLKLAGFSDTLPPVALHGSVAVVEVEGELVKRPVSMRSSLAMVSYLSLAEQVRDQLEDPAVSAVVLALQSPGGTSDGVLECVRRLRAAADAAGKPLVAFVDGMACSAGYALACACDAIVAAPDSLTASIGVVMLLSEMSAALEREGIRVHTLRSGPLKNEFSSAERKTGAQLASLQRLVDASYAGFRALVAGARGVSPEEIDALEGACLPAEHAMRAGLIDGIEHFDQLLARLNAGDSVGWQASGDGREHADTRQERSAMAAKTEPQAKAAVNDGVDPAAPAGNAAPTAPPALPQAQPTGPAATLEVRAASLAELKAALGGDDPALLVACQERGFTLEQALGHACAQLRATVAEQRTTIADLNARLGVAAQLGHPAPVADAPASASGGAGAGELLDADPSGSWDRSARLRASFGGDRGRFDAWRRSKDRQGESWSKALASEWDEESRAADAAPAPRRG